MKQVYFLLKHVVLLLVIVVSFFSCRKDDTVLDDAPRTYCYTLVVPNEDSKLEFVADSVTSLVKTIGETPAWCKVVSAGMQNTHPVFQVSYTESAPNTKNEDSKVIITFEDNSKVELLLTQNLNYVKDDNEDDPAMVAFLQDWENQDHVYIYSPNGKEDKSRTVRTPWTKGTLITSLPEEIGNDVKKKDGWEMAFSTLNIKELPSVNYFGLYNKYYGILRVFMYVDETGEGSSNYCLETVLGSSSNARQRLSFYNSLPYGIPSNHLDIPEHCLSDIKTGLTGTHTFSNFCTPYNTYSSGALKIGWTAFDINMSGFVPAGTNFLDDPNVKFQFYCRTWSDASVTLAGSLIANITGSYQEPYTTTTSSSGISSSLKTISGVAKGAGKAIGAVAKIFKEDKEKAKKDDKDEKIAGNGQTKSVAAAFSAITAVCDLGAKIYDAFIDAPTKESVDGKIDLSLTGKITLSGKIQQDKSNKIPSVQIKSDLFQKNTNIGKGVWGLSEDPIVYVVGDHCFAKARRGLVLTVKDNNRYYLPDAKESELRMITFLDPNSIKLNLNTDLFPNVSEINVKAFYGIYPNKQNGYTDDFRTLLRMPTPKIELVDRSKYKKDDAVNSSAGEFKMKLHLADCAGSNHFSSYFEENAQNCQIIKQESNFPDKNLFYYGKTEADPSIENSGFMPEPEVFFPISDDNTYVSDMHAPDFVVCVLVTFKSEGQTYFFSRRYVPRIEVIEGAALDKKYAEIKTYISKCRSHQAVGTLANSPSFPVTHEVGHLLMSKTNKILGTILTK